MEAPEELERQIADCDAILAAGGDAGDRERQVDVARALVAKGVALAGLRRVDEAVACHEEVVARFGDAEDLALRLRVALALGNIAYDRSEEGRHDEGQAAFDAMLGASTTRPRIRFGARSRSGTATRSFLVRAGRPEDALATSAEMVRRFGDDPLPAIRRDLAETLLERGRLLVDEGRRDEALAVLADVVARGAGDDDPDIHRYVGSAFTDTAELLHGDDPEGAIAALDALLARFGDLTDPNMRILVAAALARRGRYLEDQGRAREALATYRDLRDRFPRSEGPYVDRHVAHGMRRAAALAARPAERLRRRLGRR